MSFSKFASFVSKVTIEVGGISGASAKSYPCRYLSFHSTIWTKITGNIKKLVSNHSHKFESNPISGSVEFDVDLDVIAQTVRGRVSYCLERWHPSRRRIQRFPISDLVQIYVSDWKQVLKYFPLFWCRLVQRKLSRRVSYCKERRSRRRIQRFPIFDLVQILREWLEISW